MNSPFTGKEMPIRKKKMDDKDVYVYVCEDTGYRFFVNNKEEIEEYEKSIYS